MRENKNFFSLLLCLIPGAPHLYMGLKRQGIQLMLLFLLPIFLMDFLRFSTFVAFLPIIWCYSFFDGLRKRNGYEPLEDSNLFLFDWLLANRNCNRDQHRLLAYGLIGLGSMLVFQRALLPLIGVYLSYQLRNYVEVTVISLLLIGGGIKLLTTGKKEKGEDTRWEDGE